MAKKNYVVILQNTYRQNVFVEADSLEEAEALATKGEGEQGDTVEGGWVIQSSKEQEKERCAYCGGGPLGSVMIHRDGYGKGPLVPLCEVCGEPSNVTGLSNEQIWAKIGQG